MSQTAVTRAGLLSLHDAAHGKLQPSAMPRPPSLSPASAHDAGASVKDPYHLRTKADLAKGKQDGVGRTVLGRVNVNTTTTSSAVLKRSARPLSAKIPRPALAPDVFAADSNTASPGPRTLGKRSREAATTISASKRSRHEPTAASTVKALRKEQEDWLNKWQRAFPTLTFHFEIGAEDGPGRQLRSRVTKLGARIEKFFSQRVSHLIVKGNASPQKARSAAMRRHGQSDNPFLDQTGTTDLAQKAVKLGIKVWTVKKLADMLDQLDPVDVTERDTLSHILADEKIHGTRERDFSAPRPDYYYFKPGSKYVLVEDATGRNRTIMVKEYSVKEPFWPVLHDQFLRLSGSARLPPSVEGSKHVHKDMRERAMALYVNHESYKGEAPPAPSLKRSNSLRDLPTTPALPEALPYVKASGNSVVLTSNIASTSTANTTPGTLPGGVALLGATKGRTMMQMSKRVEVLKRNMPRGAKSKNLTAEHREVESDSPAPDSVARLPGTLARRKSTGMDTVSSVHQPKEFLSQAQVVAMLQQIRAPTNMSKPSCEERMRNRENVDSGLRRKEQDTASGYCENCRLRYNDLSIHIGSKKHRRFAQNPKNFADLDDMLHCLQRPPNAIMCIQTKVCRPCTKKHSMNAECGRCKDDVGLYSSPPPSSSPQSVKSQRSAPSELDGDIDMADEDDEEEEEIEMGAESVDEAYEAADY